MSQESKCLEYVFLQKISNIKGFNSDIIKNI